MAVTIVATPGAANANSYVTKVEADTYFESRLPLETPWEDADAPEAALVMAARVMNAFIQAVKVYVHDKPPYYVTRRAWTGLPSTTTQALAWPRTGMFDFNGNAIASDVIPQPLKDAQCELAGMLLQEDTTLDNAVKVQGIKSISVSSVSISFKDMIAQHVLPDAVFMLMPASWLTDELYESAMQAMFDVVPD